MTPPPALRPESKPIQVDIPKPGAPAPPGGEQITLTSVTFSGNTIFDAATLQAAMGNVTGPHQGLAGLQLLADRVTAFYRAHGYPFTSAVLPPQDVKDGVLRIDILEGRYGRIQAAGEAPLARGGQPFLDSRLQAGGFIESTALERVMLILDDQPGMKIVPVIRPGEATGSGDLSVKVVRESSYGGDIGFDNTGSRYTGEYRLRANVYADSPFLFGDKLSLRSIVTDERLWLGSLDYELPLGGSGLRGQLGYAHTSYQLGKDFAYLDASGFAKVSTLKFSYPLLRSQASNVLLSATYLHKDLEDRYGAVNASARKTSNSWPVALQFDRRDGFAGGGITYGSVSWTSGKLNLDGGLAAADAGSAKTAGRSHKFNLDVARIQKLPANVVFYGRYSAQWTRTNLDSSERFGLGGVYGVRAYPSGEGMGDKGYLLQTELRYPSGPVTPFIFYDAGKTHVNAQPWDANSRLTRSISGAGVGARVEYKGWSLDATLAWRGRGGAVQSDKVEHNPRLWCMAGYRF
ncbi:ShlB/FhaC/HecB family hemolysin secretion/activation protein [Janthinobacterium fluminis]|uniref:ShlB/FhaC/HecB family hemolysin secretion/activation protein n=1 Tax=Janthinobacterium fluminis TaxID=2987524 RepID=A0ABT5JUI6_9BURK|nr:ShlB/FhaC/HecB family hemolysin secretion/activation protein [Janthinobacterium fluminis]MDC8756304.1 ShlB/FhaC/HecB family hemolysin secretion/activation protein [Janthinobacterium fluminis]